jgi:uncharacterized protein YggU (UPF0235/DUF167 family)
LTCFSNHPFAADKDGVRLAVRLTPRASRNGIDRVALGPDGRPVLQLRVVAPPAENAANDALMQMLADALGLRKRAVSIRSGHASRWKIVHLDVDSAAIMARLADWIGKDVK